MAEADGTARGEGVQASKAEGRATEVEGGAHVSTHISNFTNANLEVGAEVDQGGETFRVVGFKLIDPLSPLHGHIVLAEWVKGIGDLFASRVTDTYASSFRWEYPARMRDEILRNYHTKG